MILKAKERGNGQQLGQYLLRDTNEHVAVHELRGFVSGDLPSALHEIDAISRGTRARNFLFSMSFNPPQRERVPVADFESAIDAVEQKLGLEGQPRAVVFHEKDGRRHAHVVWSRIDADRMKAINLPHFKYKLRDVSRQLYIEHGWQMPRGLVNSKERDPLNFDRAEWEQAKRAKADPKALKELFQDCWAISDSRKAFASALQARGYTLARGDRRGHVAVDFQGEVYAVAKWTGLKAKEVRGKLGDPKDLPSIEQANAAIAARMTEMLRQHVAKADAAHEKQAAALASRRNLIVEQQRKERAALDAALEKRWTMETAERSARLNKGVRGLWDRITGKQGRQTRENEREAWEAMKRDAREKDRLIERHIDDRQSFHQLAKQLRQAHVRDIAELHRDIADTIKRGMPERFSLREEFREASRNRGDHGKGPSRDDGPERSL